MIEKKIEFNQLDTALYIVPTPIGNLEDITLRALRILGSVDIIACEDTRTTGQLLKLLGLPKKKLLSYHDHNEKNRAEHIIKLIAEEKNSIALVSDAGMPGISDPGYRVVSSAVDAGVKVIPLPGSSAFLPALVASGLPTDSFIFMGFPPQKKGRRTFLEKAVNMPYTIILYESPHRIVKLLDEVLSLCTDTRRICLGREISKAFEEIITGTISYVAGIINSRNSVKGEFVLMIAPEDK